MYIDWFCIKEHIFIISKKNSYEFDLIVDPIDI